MNIEKVDSVTYNVQGSEKEPYMVFNSINIGWTCTCKDFVMKLPDEGVKTTHQCKHILAVRKKYNITS